MELLLFGSIGVVLVDGDDRYIVPSPCDLHQQERRLTVTQRTGLSIEADGSRLNTLLNEPLHLFRSVDYMNLLWCEMWFNR
jgi:hypothetical protein